MPSGMNERNRGHGQNQAGADEILCLERLVFQYHLLISAFTAKENVMMPMLADRGFPSAEIERRAVKLLAQVGLEKFADNLATNMSGGQQ